MENQSCQYKHRPMDPSRNQIRLFELEVDGSGDIFGTLHIVDDRHRPKYQALSYTWGPPEPTRQIFIDGRPFQIRQNLHELLQVYRQNTELHRPREYYPVSGGTSYKSKAGRSYLIWVDQICIDQNSVHERNHQVRAMGSIFRDADNVLAWLGPHQDSSSIASLFQRKAWQAWDLEPSGEEMLAWQRLLNVPYWSRHWVLQELLLARRCTILYGTDTILFDRLVNMWPVWAAQEAAKPNDHILSTFNLRKSAKWSEQLPDMFLGRILAAGTFCEDPRDKVFGLQSVLSNDLCIDIDYSKPTEYVFMDAAVRFYEHQALNAYFKAPILQTAYSMGVITRSQIPQMKKMLAEFQPSVQSLGERALEQIKIKRSDDQRISNFQTLRPDRTLDQWQDHLSRITSNRELLLRDIKRRKAQLKDVSQGKKSVRFRLDHRSEPLSDKLKSQRTELKRMEEQIQVMRMIIENTLNGGKGSERTPLANEYANTIRLELGRMLQLFSDDRAIVQKQNKQCNTARHKAGQLSDTSDTQFPLDENIGLSYDMASV